MLLLRINAKGPTDEWLGSSTMASSLSNQQRLPMNNRLLFGQKLISQRCLLCGAKSGPKGICQACDAELPRLGGSLCRQCATPIWHAELCGSCIATPPRFDRAFAAFEYTFPVDALIHALKYGGRLAVARLLAEAMAHLAIEEVDVLVPMPLTGSRVRERGFNQAQEIALHIGRERGIRVGSSLCRRVLDTPPQAVLPWKVRAKNVRGAFVCDANLRGMRIAVIDDVATTGSSLNELSRVLKLAGAARVIGWVAARAVLQARASMQDYPRLMASIARV